MEIDAYDHGVPSWIDVFTDDPDATATFFTELFGWDCPEGPPEFGGYRSCTRRGRRVAGISPKMAPEAPTVFSSYVNVDDADAIEANVLAAGGSVLATPMDVGDLGRMGVFIDPAGAVIGVWQAGEHKGAGLVNEPGTLCWNELVTDDVEGSKAFYAAVFGWGADTKGEGGDAYTEWQVGGRSVGGMMAKRPDMGPVPNHWMVYFAVEDADATLARIGELGGNAMMPVMDIEPGRFAVVAEPTGAVFSILQMKEGLAGG